MRQTQTSLNCFKDCPRAYKARYVVGDMPKQAQHPSAVRGDKAHKAIEDYLTTRKELPDFVKPIQPALDALLASGLPIYVEQGVGITDSFEPVAYEDRRAYLRGKADVIMVSADEVFVLDWKTGKPSTPEEVRKYGEKTAVQANLLAIVAGKVYKKTKITTMFVYLDHDIIKITEHHIDEDGYKLFSKYDDLFKLLERIKKAGETGRFIPIKGGLCKFCALNTCRFNEAFEGDKDYD